MHSGTSHWKQLLLRLMCGTLPPASWLVGHKKILYSERIVNTQLDAVEEDSSICAKRLPADTVVLDDIVGQVNSCGCSHGGEVAQQQQQSGGVQCGRWQACQLGIQPCGWYSRS